MLFIVLEIEIFILMSLKKNKIKYARVQILFIFVSCKVYSPHFFFVILNVSRFKSDNVIMFLHANLMVYCVFDTIITIIEIILMDFVCYFYCLNQLLLLLLLPVTDVFNNYFKIFFLSKNKTKKLGTDFFFFFYRQLDVKIDRSIYCIYI